MSGLARPPCKLRRRSCTRRWEGSAPRLPGSFMGLRLRVPEARFAHWGTRMYMLSGGPTFPRESLKRTVTFVSTPFAKATSAPTPADEQNCTVLVPFRRAKLPKRSIVQKSPLAGRRALKRQLKSLMRSAVTCVPKIGGSRAFTPPMSGTCVSQTASVGFCPMLLETHI